MIKNYSLAYFAYSIISLFELSSSMKVSFPTFNKNLAVINNIDIKKANEFDKSELVKLFKFPSRSCMVKNCC